MKRVIVTMLAASMFVSSAFAAGSIGQSIDSTSKAFKASTGLSTSVIQVSQSGAQLASEGATTASTVLKDLSVTGINSVEGVSVNLIDHSEANSSIELKSLYNGLRISVRISAKIARAIPKGANLILQRTAQGAYVLLIQGSNVVIDALQLDLDESLVGLLMLAPNVVKAMATSQDEIRQNRATNIDK